jgi:hypothetical protein
MKFAHCRVSADIKSVLRRLGFGVVLLAALIAGPGLYGEATSGSRIGPDLFARTGFVNVRVTLGFTPQQFHQQRLTSFGVFAGRNGNSINLLRVPTSRLGQLASLYWVDSIEPLRSS